MPHNLAFARPSSPSHSILTQPDVVVSKEAVS